MFHKKTMFYIFLPVYDRVRKSHSRILEGCDRELYTRFIRMKGGSDGHDGLVVLYPPVLLGDGTFVVVGGARGYDYVASRIR